MVDTIRRLKKETGAYIMAHNYESREIQELADFAGDSLAMARKAAETDAELLVVCGVYFMAETAAILNPGKTVLIPDATAGCPLADFAPADKVREWREKYPEHTFVTYVNSSAEVKALSDVCCTSSNALKIVQAVDNDRIVFLPDRNLGSYVAEQCGKEVLLWPGCCPVHDAMTPEAVKEARERITAEKVMTLIHPECPVDVRAEADVLCSTGQMFSVIRENPDVKDFLIVTEGNMIHALQREFPSHHFYEPAKPITCRNMAKITPEKLEACLREQKYRVEVDSVTARKAETAIRRMLKLS